MNWPDGWTVVEGWKGAKGVEPRYHRAPDGLAGRSHDRGGVADTLRVGGRASGAGDSYDNTPWIADTLTAPVRAVSDDGLPLGLDSHRYRCCGNGVVSSVAEWIGYRLAEALA